MILEKFSLKGKSGIVTGGGSGIGKGIATGLIQAGAEVIIAGRNIDKLQRTKEELGRDGGRVVPLPPPRRGLLPPPQRSLAGSPAPPPAGGDAGRHLHHCRRGHRRGLQPGADPQCGRAPSGWEKFTSFTEISDETGRNLPRRRPYMLRRLRVGAAARRRFRPAPRSSRFAASARRRRSRSSPRL